MKVLRPWIKTIAGSAAGAIALLLVGRGLAADGGTCAILCNPAIAALYGAAIGFLLVGPPRRELR